jgi:hypothetical protein
MNRRKVASVKRMWNKFLSFLTFAWRKIHCLQSGHCRFNDIEWLHFGSALALITELSSNEILRATVFELSSSKVTGRFQKNL